MLDAPRGVMVIRGPQLTARGALLVLLALSADAYGRSFADNFGKGFGRIVARSLAGSVARTLPVLAASAGLVYRFDPETGAFERDVSILGQLYLERPDPIGRERFDLSFSWQRVKFDTFEGKDLEALHDTRFPIRERNGALFTVPRFGIDLDTHEVVTSATYGVGDDLELNLTVPVIYSEFGLNVATRGINVVEPPPFETRSSKLGVGDLLVRSKYGFFERDWLHGAFGLVLRVPTGNEDNFQGTGAVELAPMLYLSRDPVPLSRYARLQPYLNGGVNFDTDDVDSSEARWGIGLDFGLIGRLTAAVAFLGRHPFARVGRAGAFDFPRGYPRSRAMFTSPLFGIEPRRPDFYDFSVGGRVNLWRDRVFGFVNAIVPLNRDGFRADVIPLAGLESSF